MSGPPMSGPPGYPAPGQPGFPPPGGPAFPAPGQPPYGAPAPVKKKRGLLIASIVLAVALLLCGGGGTAAFLVLRNAETGEGAPSPTEAVIGFLTAVYTDQDAKQAAALVCPAARDDKAIAKRVKEVRDLATTYKNPRFSWSVPKVDDQNAERAVVSTKVTMATGDEKVSRQDLKFTVVQSSGWWVCEVA
ncbi:Rv0361 family membrane protein [Micromonospora echinofusca]